MATEDDGAFWSCFSGKTIYRGAIFCKVIISRLCASLSNCHYYVFYGRVGPYKIVSVPVNRAALARRNRKQVTCEYNAVFLDRARAGYFGSSRNNDRRFNCNRILFRMLFKSEGTLAAVLWRLPSEEGTALQGRGRGRSLPVQAAYQDCRPAGGKPLT